MEKYNCNYCEKEYKSMSARSQHYNLKHKDEYVKDKLEKKNKKYNCEYCEKKYSTRQSCYYHRKKCNKIIDNKYIKLQNEVTELKNKLNNVLLESQKTPNIIQKINKQLINNGTINNITNIITFGNEDLNNILTQNEILEILKHKKNH